jgi:hypothetical protein
MVFFQQFNSKVKVSCEDLDNFKPRSKLMMRLIPNKRSSIKSTDVKAVNTNMEIEISRVMNKKIFILLYRKLGTPVFDEILKLAERYSKRLCSETTESTRLAK